MLKVEVASSVIQGKVVRTYLYRKFEDTYYSTPLPIIQGD